MRKLDSREFIHIFWPHLAGDAVLIALFVFQLIFVLPGRPSAPDPVAGYTVEWAFGSQAVYVSVFDLVLLFGTVLLGMVIVAVGILRVRKAQQSAGGPGL